MLRVLHKAFDPRTGWFWFPWQAVSLLHSRDESRFALSPCNEIPLSERPPIIRGNAFYAGRFSGYGVF